MPSDIALRRYLQRHIEPDLPGPPAATRPWRNVLVIPAYRESPDLPSRLARSLQPADPTLVLLVLNRPDSDRDPGANTGLRAAVRRLPPGTPGCHRLNPRCELYLHDVEALSGPSPAKRGVGLARKTGCDIALQWMSSGAIDGDWICCSDADALLPRNYFERLQGVSPDAVAAVSPFEHIPGPDRACSTATALYELRLHHYVLGLEHAASPYACHTLGSCLAIRVSTYARVHGLPRRAGGEDFYLLNKARKLGPVARLEGEAIALRSRLSNRVPFGTGPAVREIIESGPLENQTRFYHPGCFEALRAVLQVVPSPANASLPALPALLESRGLQETAAARCVDILSDMGLAGALAHCRTQGRTDRQFRRHFHQWFDAFRTLKFIHALRDTLYPDQSLATLRSLQPQLWPADGDELADVEKLRRRIRSHWHWISPGHTPGW